MFERLLKAMGGKAATERQLGKGHPERFYEACQQVEDGCYTTAELYFTQAIANHPGNEFWTNTMAVFLTHSVRKAPETTTHSNGTAEHDLRSPTAPPDENASTNTGIFQRSEDEVESVTPPVDLPRWPLANTTTPAKPAAVTDHTATTATAFTATVDQTINGVSGNHTSLTATSQTDAAFTIPVDKQLVDIENYARMLSDIARIYRRKAATSVGDSRDIARRISMMYNAYTAVRLQILLNLLRVHFDKHFQLRDKQGLDMFNLHEKRGKHSISVGTASAAPSTRRSSVVEVEMSQPTQTPSPVPQAEFTMHAQDFAICTFWETIQYLWTANINSYVMSALRTLRSPDIIVPPALVKAVFEMSMTSYGALETQLQRSADINSHVYIGSVMQTFIKILQNATAECVSREVSQATSTRSGGTASHPRSRTAKEHEVTWVPLSATASYTSEQTNFLRLAKSFNVAYIPTLDPMRAVGVNLELPFNPHQIRAAKLMTPLDRDVSWYLTIAFRNSFGKKGGNDTSTPHLRKRCDVPPGSTIRDWPMFVCIGMEEMMLSLFPSAVGKAIVLQALGKTALAHDLAKRSLQVVTSMYGGPTPVSEILTSLFEHIFNDAPI